MKELKKGINEVLAQTAVDITELTGCFMLWGEVELPECLRVEEKKMVMNCVNQRIWLYQPRNN